MVIAVVYGLLIGSFLNAWAWRLAHDEKISRGPLALPALRRPDPRLRQHPGRQLAGAARAGAGTAARRSAGATRWGRRSRRCCSALSPAFDGLSWLLIPQLLFVSALVLVSQVDLEIRIIPDVVILPVGGDRRCR